MLTQNMKHKTHKRKTHKRKTQTYRFTNSKTIKHISTKQRTEKHTNKPTKNI